MNDRRDQYICAALVRQPYNPNVTPEETAKCIVRLADALLAAAGEQKPAAITQDELLGDANLFAAIFADKRQVAGMIARAEAAESKLAACEMDRDKARSWVGGLQAELAEAVGARNAAARERDEMHAALERVTSALSACERERDALKRRLEPLTEEEASEVMRPVIYGSLPPTHDQVRSIVDDADRIRARRA